VGFAGRVAFWILPSQQGLLLYLLRAHTKYTVCDVPYTIGVKLASVTLSSRGATDVHRIHLEERSKGASLGRLVTSMIISVCHNGTSMDAVFANVTPAPDVWFSGGTDFTNHLELDNPCPPWYVCVCVCVYGCACVCL
jgi:hypothetical protein